MAANSNFFELASYVSSVELDMLVENFNNDVDHNNAQLSKETSSTSTTEPIVSTNASKYNDDFIEESVIGSGGFGTVFKCQSNADNRVYAIKKVAFDAQKRETVFKELKFLSQLDSKFVVKYFDSWVEENFTIIDLCDNERLQNIRSSNPLFNPNLRYLLHIQMEFCSLTLRDVIEDIIIKECLTRDNTLSLIGYYISSEMFIEILECVQYLHSQNLPIIHRDLKPANILLNFNNNNNRFVKLCDFGLSTLHEFPDQSHTGGNVGTVRYIAPEILSAHSSNGKIKANYTTKADCYSLGTILQDLFHLFDNSTPRIVLPVLEQKMNKIDELAEELHSPKPPKRPTCDLMLRDFDLLRLYDDDMATDESFKQIITNSTNSNSIDVEFKEFFVHNKYKFNTRPKTNAALNKRSTNASKYKDDFIEESVIGSGGFGTVFKCQSNADNRVYAIKKVAFSAQKQETVFKKLKFLSQLDSKFVVKYIDSWVEENFTILDSYHNKRLQNIRSSNPLFNPNLRYRYLLHIQMEFCSLTLRDVIEDIIIKECLTRDNTLSLIGYFISSELFIEILECVQYLHSQNPPIIHRDLKPENFLINYRNNRFIKLSGFGLSTFQSHTAGSIGTIRYIAPEVFMALSTNSSNGKMKSKYTTQADVYSLGIILQELFHFDNSRKYLSTLRPKINKLNELSEKLHSLSTDKRPKCDAMLRDFNLLQLSDKEMATDESFTQIITNSTNSYSIDAEFKEFFVHNKYKFNTKDQP